MKPKRGISGSVVGSDWQTMSVQSHIPSVMTEDIVISGMSGRFPESDSTDAFAENLFNKTDLFSEDDRRWPTGMSSGFAREEMYSEMH